MNKTKTEKQIEELQFKLNTLSHFVYHHHHNYYYETAKWNTDKAKVWVHYPNGWKEEGEKKE
jgi:hypothetical protein